MLPHDSVGYKKEPTNGEEPMSATPGPRAWAVLAVLSGAIFLEGIDVSMMGVALPSMRADLGLTTGELQWVVSAYVLGYGGFVLLGGRAADLLGRRRMFLLWLTVFVAFSGMGGLAVDGWMLVTARFVTGVAAAFLTPAGLSIITTTFAEGPLRNKALLVYSGMGAGGFTLGMVAGGLLTALGWRWVFFAPVLVAAVLLAAAIPLLPADGPRAGSGRFDVAGTATLTSGAVLLVLGIAHAPETTVGVTALTLAGAVALLTAFVLVERRVAAPLVRLGILRSAALRRANTGAMLLLGSFMGFQFVAVLHLQEVLGWSTVQTGLALAVAGIDAVLAPTVTPLLVNRFGGPRVVVAGMVSAALGYALFLPLGSTFGAVVPTFLAIGLAFTCAYGPLTIMATDGVEAHEQGLASGVLVTSQQFGTAIGLAVVTAVVVAVGGGVVTPEALRAGLVVSVVAAVVGIVVAATGVRRRVGAQPAAA